MKRYEHHAFEKGKIAKICFALFWNQILWEAPAILELARALWAVPSLWIQHSWHFCLSFARLLQSASDTHLRDLMQPHKHFPNAGPDVPGESPVFLHSVWGVKHFQPPGTWEGLVWNPSLLALMLLSCSRSKHGLKRVAEGLLSVLKAQKEGMVSSSTYPFKNNSFCCFREVLLWGALLPCCQWAFPAKKQKWGACSMLLHSKWLWHCIV